MRNKKTVKISRNTAATLVRLVLAVCGGAIAAPAPAHAQLGFFLPNPSSPLRQIFGDRIHSITCPGCTANKSFNTEKTIQLPYIISSLVWSPDGKYLAVGSLLESKVDIYDTSTWNLVGHIQAVADGDGTFDNQFTSDSQYLIRPPFAATDTDNISLQKWDINTATLAGNFPSVFASEQGMPNNREWHDSYAKAVATSASGDLVAASAGGNAEGHILIYNSTNYSIQHDIVCGFRAAPSAMAFSPDNHELVVGECHAGNIIEAYNIDTGKMKFETALNKSSWIYTFLVYSPDGSMIAVSADSGDSGTITILRASDGSVLNILPTENATITNLQWMSANLLLASYDDVHPDGNTARIWDVSSGKVVGGYAGGNLQLVSLSPDHARLAAAIGTDIVVGQLK